MNPPDPTKSNESTEPTDSLQTGQIVANPGREFRLRRGIMAVVIVVMGVWFAYDGWVAWPRSNAEHARINKELDQAIDSKDKEQQVNLTKELGKYKEHTWLDMGLQRGLAIVLIPAGIFLLSWWMYQSRGQVRLTADDVLHMPGHPPVPLSAITDFDKRKWDRKGIAKARYDLSKTGTDTRSGRLTLDDFAYQRPPIDAIVARIDATRPEDSASGAA